MISKISKLTSKLDTLWGIKKEFRQKVFFLTLTFFFMTACQAIWRPLKQVVFMSLVGAKSIPNAKMYLIIPIIILILIYSKLVDWLRRHQLLYAFTISHGAIALIFAYFLLHPVYGLANTVKSEYRIIGWLFYFFMESFGAFMSATFWAFANSINKPSDAKNYYGLLVTGSKIGGISGAGILYLFATFSTISDHVLVSNFVFIGSLLLFAASGSIYFLMKLVPGYYMHGYEAAYQAEKKQSKLEQKLSKKQTTKTGLLRSIKNAFEGLITILKNPYVFGIFSIILFYEVIIVIFDYIVATKMDGSSIKTLASFYASYFFNMHLIGLIIAFFGTAPLQRLLGIRLSLFLCPTISIMIMATALIYPSTTILFFSLVVLRALNYGLNHPTREALFIPTTKAIKFKAKAWTDAFGSRISKASGSWLNKHFLHGLALTSIPICLVISSIWIIVTYFLGKTFQKAINENKVIGEESIT